MKNLIKIIFFCILIILNNNSFAEKTNEILFTINKDIYTSIDLENRIKFINLYEGRLIEYEKSLLEDYVSVLLFDYYLKKEKFKIKDIEEEIIYVYEKIKNNILQNENDKLKKILLELPDEYIKSNIRLNIQRKKIIEFELNKVSNIIFEDSITEINNIYDIVIKYVSLSKNLINNNEIKVLINNNIKNANLQKIKDILLNNNLDFIYKEKKLNFTQKINKDIKEAITNNKNYFFIENQEYLIFGNIFRNFKDQKNIKYNLTQIVSNQELENKLINCSNISNFQENQEDGIRIILNENLDYLNLNDVIKDNIIKIGDYIHVKNNLEHIYIILCEINYDNEILKETNINEKINFLAIDIEKKFIKEKSIEFKLNYL